MFANGFDTVEEIVFSTPGDGPSLVAAPGEGTLDSVITFTAQAGNSNAFSGLDDSIFIGPFNQSGRILTIRESYCLGATSITSCPAGQSGTLVSVQDGVHINSAFTTFAPTFNLITVQLDVTVRNDGEEPFGPSELPVFLHEADPPPQGEGAAAAPEPSELILIGTGFTLLGLVRFGKRKKRGGRGRETAAF